MKLLSKKQNIMLVIGILLLIMLSVLVLSELSDGGSINTNGSSSNAIEVSLISLISNPSKFNGKLVSVTGVSSVSNEYDAIYVSKDDYRYKINGNAICLDFNSSAVSRDKAYDLNGKYVNVEGIFRYEYNGDSYNFMGTIDSIKKIESVEIDIRK